MLPRMDRETVFRSIGFSPRARNILVTFHPVTLADDSDRQCAELLAALNALGSDLGVIFTGVNADTGRASLAAMIGEFARSRDNAVLVETLGSQRYFSALSHVDAVVGNSSSGLYEAPSFHLPTVNIGERQDGRLRASSVIDCSAQRAAIAAAIRRAFEVDCSAVVNPYGDGRASERIVAALKQIGDPVKLVKKKFYDWNEPIA
jgi:UDP-N-acetylglucosamine 2-epimerase (non-hydrolysing)/GDP/UDP-N,N'-diacetylbacillosamine 2-epimerase (hydrolysing)